ncbi:MULTISPECIES: hypothetical protein [unclassified Streptomyces]|uniref:hypothetical protein n=1 Tax=unclassified Streptomyces TaxID=2593676 RepID=UPI00081F050D|nr:MULTISPECIES: hypothetical protein [unclassified Streptomyces]MYZ34351.1 hypothetical protein [Streptomyces sp. SID4917]SCF66682.1 hypothetical protein GA0115259_1008417 [Streptomyces sp. MnatMP-M17]
MPTTVITAADIIRHYAAAIAYVAEKDKDQATDIGTFADQLGTAARNFLMARIDGHEDVQTAAAFLHEAHVSIDANERTVFLRKADKLLAPIVWDMTEEYRGMVGDGDEGDG